MSAIRLLLFDGETATYARPIWCAPAKPPRTGGWSYVVTANSYGPPAGIAVVIRQVRNAVEVLHERPFAETLPANRATGGPFPSHCEYATPPNPATFDGSATAMVTVIAMPLRAIAPAIGPVGTAGGANARPHAVSATVQLSRATSRRRIGPLFAVLARFPEHYGGVKGSCTQAYSNAMRPI
ncbi:MAG TPA: hypothetical protein VNG31_07670 [Candidatus Baltobacteraceae bacterium]|nr:hypothetical protein [Candidatus Baltobacteraceae bacterium]